MEISSKQQTTYFLINCFFVCFQIELVDPSGQIMETDGDVTVERLWDDGAPVNITTLALKKGLATFTYVPDAAHVNSTLNLVVR